MMSERLSVLVVDNEPSARETIAALLEPEGHEILLAESGREALSRLADRAPPARPSTSAGSRSSCDVILHQVPFLDPAFLLLGEGPEDFAQPFPEFPIDRLLAVLWNEHHVVLTLPPGVGQTLVVAHANSLS